MSCRYIIIDLRVASRWRITSMILRFIVDMCRGWEVEAEMRRLGRGR